MSPASRRSRLLLLVCLSLLGCARSRPRPVVPPRAEAAPAPPPSATPAPAESKPPAAAQAPAEPPKVIEFPPGVRFTPPGAMYSVEFPGTPKCQGEPQMTDCRYVDPASGWTFHTTHWKDNLQSTDELKKNPSANLRGRITFNASNEGLEVLQNAATVVDGFAAADYRMAPTSDAPSPVYSAGQFINLGDKIVQIVHLGIDGKEAPPDEVVQHFVKSFRVEGGGQGLAPLPPSIASLVQGSLVKPGAFPYQTVVERNVWDRMAEREPIDYSLQTKKRTIQRTRDKKREAIIVTETGRLENGKFNGRYWLDAKTLVPYRLVSSQTKFVSMLNKNQTSSLRLELVDGVLKIELGGSAKGKLDVPAGETALFMPGAGLELAVSTLPLEEGFLGSLRVFDVAGLFGGQFYSDWRVLVQYAPQLTSIASLEAGKGEQIKVFKVELLEHKAKSPRRYTFWIENSPARRILQVEEFSPGSQGSTTVHMLQSKR